MKFKIENCESNRKIQIETTGKDNEDLVSIIESVALFIIDDKMDMDTKKVIEEHFYRQGLYNILEDAIEEAARLKNNNWQIT